MICKYCENSLHDGDAGVYNCLHCPNNVRYICSGDWSNPEIYYIQFYKDKYQLELSVVDGTSGLFFLPFGNPNHGGAYVVKTIMSFDKLLDITPTGYDAWLERIVNLKVFF